MDYQNGGLSPSDVALLQGRNGNGGSNGFGGDGAWWIVLFLIFALGGWGNNNGGGNNGGGFGGGSGGFNDGYAWLSNGQKEIMQNTNQGFNTLHLSNQIDSINNGINSLSSQLCSCCCDMRDTVNQGFYNAEIAASNRQMADMQQNYTNQLSTLQSFNSLGSQLSDCCCENRLATERLNATILSENCADRAALQEGVRDIIQSQNFGVQRILDQLCNDKIDSKNEKIADLQRELQMADLRASQIAQTAQIREGQVQEIDQMYQRLRDCPVRNSACVPEVSRYSAVQTIMDVDAMVIETLFN